MNRKYLLDSLDGFKGLVFRLLPPHVAGSVACVPMTTDAPWTDADKTAFEKAIGIPRERTHWMPGGFANVPPASDKVARSRWVQAVAALSEPCHFLDPDTGFYDRLTNGSEKMVLVTELETILRSRDALIVYRHQYWPQVGQDGIPANVYPYVWHGLRMLKGAGLCAFAYQSRAASLFFISRQPSGLLSLERGLRTAMLGMSPNIVNRRLVV
ncbi:MAG: hypothetical protein ABSG91_03560 [Syntrophobacteraceae bacterium]|jgi:hypothetical protein